LFLKGVRLLHLQELLLVGDAKLEVVLVLHGVELGQRVADHEHLLTSLASAQVLTSQGEHARRPTLARTTQHDTRHNTHDTTHVGKGEGGKDIFLEWRRQTICLLSLHAHVTADK
jgi:hypothetical protein